MDALAGTGQLLRFVLRLERAAFAVWIGVLGLIPAIVAGSFKSLYPTDAAVQEAASAVGGTTALVALLGPVRAASIGGLTAWRIGAPAAALVAVFTVLTVIRHTRADEELGRHDLLGSMAIGRHAPLAAAVLAATVANTAIAVLTTAGLVAQGQPLAGSVAMGLASGLTGWAFTGIAAVAAQMTESARAARSIAIAMVGGTFLLRMLGDASSGMAWASWLSPIGWAQQLRAFADEAWWVMALPIALGAGMLAVARRLATGRDIGAGMLATRPGPATADVSFGSPMALAWRLQRGVLLAWTIGLAVFGAVIGGIAPGMSDLVGGSEQFLEIIERMGGSGVLEDAFLAGVMGNIAIAAAAFAIAAILRLRTEETELRAEPVLATVVSRTQWLVSHAVIAVGGIVVLMLVCGTTAGVTFGLADGDVARQLPRVLSATLVQLPAIAVFGGVALVLVGWLPHHTGWSWGFLAGTFLIAFLGAILGIGQAALNVSPFTHTPSLPVADLELLPVVVMSLVAIALGVTGWRGLLHRDIV